MTTIKLDYDVPEAPPIGWWMFRALNLTVQLARWDRTANGWHVLIWVKEELEPTEIVALQAILGSDPRREAFNLMRVRSLEDVPEWWRGKWNVLFERKL